MRTTQLSFLAMFSAVTLAGPALAAGAADSLKAGKPDLRSAGRLAFGPDGVLFVGDSVGAAIVALDTADTTPVAQATAIDMTGIDGKVAGLLGTTPDKILINAITVNPISKRAYLAVSRGRGPDATPVIVRTAAGGKLEMLSLDNIKSASVKLPNALSGEGGADQRRRMDAITDVAYTNGKVVVAGLSNEEFASNLRMISYPFTSADRGASAEIFHGSHGGFETNAPIRTFMPYKVNGEDVILAAYTCTPLVMFKAADLTPGNKVKGKTIAELGAGNRPLDMFGYKKDGADYILMNNSSRGVMKIKAAKLESYPAITRPTDITGVPYDTVKSLQNVEHLAKLDETQALMLVKTSAGEDLKTIALP
jgi:hypothetical protein